MSELRHVKRIIVSLWGQRVGTIVPTGTRGETYAFQYDRKFLRSGIELSPLMMPLRKEPYVFADLPRSEYAGLPPAFSDSLPDAFGRGLIDRWLEEKGYVRSEITALDRLAYIGRRATGALTYEPDHGPGGRPAAFEMRKLVEAARKAANGELANLDAAEALRAILRIGSSVGGAQAKALIGWNRETNQFLFGDRDLPDGFEHWIIKFTPKEYPWRGPTEYEIYKRARAAGIDISKSVLYELDGLGHFMTRRFDRDGMRHHHVQTLSAMAHFPMSVPAEFRTYEQYLATVDALHLGYEAMEEAFRRIAFNIAIDECDDHTKNFSFMLKEGGEWALAPAYDLTGSKFPSEDPWSAHGGCHQLSVNGKQSKITDDDLLQVADRFALGTAPRVIRAAKSSPHWHSLASTAVRSSCRRSGSRRDCRCIRGRGKTPRGRIRRPLSRRAG